MDVVSAPPFWAFQNIQTQIVAEASLDTSNCTVQSDGVFTENPGPQYGTWTSAIVDLTIPQGDVCAGYKLPFNVASYTWTDSPATSSIRLNISPRASTKALSDKFTLLWALTKGGTPVDTFNFTADFAPRITYAEPTGFVDVTYQNTAAAVGQQISVSIQPGPAPGQTGLQWTVTSTTLAKPVGGFSPTADECSSSINDCPMAPDLVVQPASLYFTDAGTEGEQHYYVDYSYSIGAVKSPPVFTEFGALGPYSVPPVDTFVTINTDGPGNQPIQIVNNRLSFGSYNGKTGRPGINFDARATKIPARVTGKFVWAQIISYFTISFYSGGAVKKICSVNDTPGLDSTWPYPSVPNIDGVTNDVPSWALYNSYDKAIATFEAKMYLLWEPQTISSASLNSSIPVTLGYVNWGWTGVATRTGTVWSVDPSLQTVDKVTFTSSSTYPQWTQLALRSVNTCKSP